jgi:hypothetical protein
VTALKDGWSAAIPIASSRHHAGVPDYHRNFTAGCGFFFERLRDVQQGDGFRKGSTHPTGYGLTPHNAADTDPDEISKYVAGQIERLEAGDALENVVDPARGY